MYYTSICAIAKDEDKDIKEWLYYHLAIGFEHVLIYDNNSSIPLREQLREFIDNKLVTVIDMPLTSAQQLSSYNHALAEWKNKTQWLAFIDIDEFILPLEKTDIRDLLDDYIDYGALGINWCMFSSNNHISRPVGGILPNYTASLGLNRHIKSIVRPAVTKRAVSPHHFVFNAPYYCVNEDFIPIRNFYTYPLANKIRINHYYYKSQMDFYDKINRGLGTQIKSTNERKIDTFYAHLDKPTEIDKKILKFIPLMRKLAKLPLSRLNDYLLPCCAVSDGSPLERLAQSLKNANYSEALNIYKKVVRYYPLPQTHILGARLNFILNNHEAGLKILRRLFASPDLTEAEYRQCYSALSDHYRLSGQAKAANEICAYLS